MPKADLFTQRKPLGEICSVPDKIISVYALEKHIWADSGSREERKKRQPERKTIEEFQLDPVRPFLTDVLRNVSAPYNRQRKDDPIGQGYWIQAEFGSGKSHLLCTLAALALGDKKTWDIINDKEQKAGRGKRESLYQFWEGISAKSAKGKKGILVVVKTLTGVGGTVGMGEKGKSLTEYVLDAAKEQLFLETGKNLSLYPAELVADRFINQDLDRWKKDLQKFLKDPKYFEEDEQEDVDDFLRDIQQNKSPEFKKSRGNKLWRFYTEYLKVQPQIPSEPEETLKNMVETILEEGYSGVLIILDEVSLFMKDRKDVQRDEDEKTLVVLSNRLAQVENLPVWTVCAAQQAIESKMGAKNIIADDRLKLVPLLRDANDYYDIVLSRVRSIKNEQAVSPYYVHYKRGFTWPNSIGQQEFERFFPFHKPALELLRYITYSLTTTRSAIHFMHQTLKHQIKVRGCELIRLWEIFDEAVEYEEDPSGSNAGLAAIKTQRENEYHAYEACRRQIESLTKGHLKMHRDRAIKTIQTLFLYHIAKTREQGLSAEEIANDVLIERDDNADPGENIMHYETLASNLKKELRQIAESPDEDGNPRYRFDPVFTGVDPNSEFKKARDEAESNEKMRLDAWDNLLALDKWEVRTRRMTLDLTSGVHSVFRDIAPLNGKGDQRLEIDWQGRQTLGQVGMRDLARLASEKGRLPVIDTAESEVEFAVYVSTAPANVRAINKVLEAHKDARLLLWTPEKLTHDEEQRLLDFAAYRKLVADWQGKDSEDAVTVIHWVANALQSGMANIKKIVDSSYERGRVDALDNTKMECRVAGELRSMLEPLAGRCLTSIYESQEIKFDPPFFFRREEAVKVINGIVKTGSIPKGAKPNQNISAAQNFGFGLKIMKKSAEKQLDVSGNRFVSEMWAFIDGHLTDESQAMKMETLHKNFMGINGANGKHYGLTRRIVQVYLLCLVKEGKVRIQASDRAGLPSPTVDYSSIGDIDFSARILDNLVEVQKMARPENWEVLRPYAEKLLNEPIPSTHDDAQVSGYRKQLRELFDSHRGLAPQTVQRAKAVFAGLKAANPYEEVLEQFVELFQADLKEGTDIDVVIYQLKEVLGYGAYDKNASDQAEVDDLANRFKNYNDVRRFLNYEMDLLAAAAYCERPFPNHPTLTAARRIQERLSKKLENLQTYVDSDVKLKTELVGAIPAAPGEKNTLGALVKEYTSVYSALHDSVTDQLEADHKAIQKLLTGDELKALKILEDISALQPPVADALERQLNDIAGRIPLCSDPSAISVSERLCRGPFHDCGLTFDNAEDRLKEGRTLAEKAESLFEDLMARKCGVFLTPSVRQRLEQGKSEDLIGELLKCKTEAQVRAYLVAQALNDPSMVEVINRHLKLVEVRTIRLADFRPTLTTIEEDQIPEVVQEFEAFLRTEMQEVKGKKDALPVLQVE